MQAMVERFIESWTMQRALDVQLLENAKTAKDLSGQELLRGLIRECDKQLEKLYNLREDCTLKNVRKQYPNGVVSHV